MIGHVWNGVQEKSQLAKKRLRLGYGLKRLGGCTLEYPPFTCIVSSILRPENTLSDSTELSQSFKFMIFARMITQSDVCIWR